MTNWEKKKLKDVSAYLNRGVSPKYSEGGNLVVNQKCIRNNVVSLDEARYSSLDKKITVEKMLQPFDILVNSTGTGTLGRTAQIKNILKPTTVDTHVTIVRANEKADKVFLGLALRYNEPNIASLGKGATNQQELGRDDLGALEISLPPLPIQRRIATILSTYDDLIENNLRRIKLLEELAQRTYEEWFVKFRINDVALEIEEETGLPIGWERRKLIDVLLIKNGKAFKEIEGVKKIPIYGSNGIIGVSSTYNNENAIIIGRVGAYCGSIFYCRNKFWATDNTIMINEFSDTFSNAYAYFTLIKLDLRRFAGGAAQPLLTQTTINQLEITVPNKENVIEFSNICKNLFMQIDNLQSQNRHLKATRDILLPRLMNGSIAVEG